MILSRIIGHLRELNWTAAGLEILIVVVGVFLGIQFSNWNEERQDAARADEYLARILEDVTADVETFDQRIELWTEVVDRGNAALAFARSGVAADQTHWEVLSDFYLASQWLPFNSANTTFKEMTSAGELGLIANTRLRAELSDYYYRIEFREPLYEGSPDYRKTVRALTPLPIQNYFWSDCEQGTADHILAECDPSIPVTQAQTVVDHFLATPDVVGDLRYWVINLGVTISAARRDRDKAANLAQRIEEELR